MTRALTSMKPIGICACPGDTCGEARVVDGDILCGFAVRAMQTAIERGWEISPPGTRKRRGHVTPEMADEMIRRASAGEGYSAIARSMGLAPNCVATRCRDAGLSLRRPARTP